MSSIEESSTEENSNIRFDDTESCVSSSAATADSSGVCKMDTAAATSASTGARHWFGPNSPKSKGAGHPVMYGKPKEALHFTAFQDGGGYPIGFVEWAFAEMRKEHSGVLLNPDNILHLCSGSMKTGTTVDIRSSLNPTFVADVRDMRHIIKDESFDFIMADPPYSEEYAENLYKTGSDYPKPGQILKESARILRPGGLVGIMHFQVPMARKPLKLIRVYGITTGAGYAIRAWSLYRKV